MSMRNKNYLVALTFFVGCLVVMMTPAYTAPIPRMAFPTKPAGSANSSMLRQKTVIAKLIPLESSTQGMFQNESGGLNNTVKQNLAILSQFNITPKAPSSLPEVSSMISPVISGSSQPSPNDAAVSISRSHDVQNLSRLYSKASVNGTISAPVAVDASEEWAEVDASEIEDADIMSASEMDAAEMEDASEEDAADIEDASEEDASENDE